MLKELLSFDAYQVNCKRNIALIKTLVEESNSYQTKQIAELLNYLLEVLPIDKLAEQLDTFLSSTIILSFSCNIDDKLLSLYQEYILLHLFDNYYDVIPQETMIKVGFNNFVLPKLNIFIKNTINGESLITKKDNSTCVISTVDSEYQYIIKKPHICAEKINIIDFSDPSAYFFLFKNFIPSKEIERFCKLENSLLEKMNNSLEFINNVDKALYNNIRSNINYLIPLQLQEDGIRTSFSSAEINGTIFISDGGTILDFCEALIHEYYHNELNIYLQFDPLFTNDENNLYYSPWRPDPRPIGGLFHAIYVFTGVCLFYVKVLHEYFYHEDVKIQLSSIMKKLAIAFCQIREEDLCENGKKLLVKLYQKFNDICESENIDLSPDEKIKNAIHHHSAIYKAELPDFLSANAILM